MIFATIQFDRGPDQSPRAVCFAFDTDNVLMAGKLAEALAAGWFASSGQPALVKALTSTRPRGLAIAGDGAELRELTWSKS